MKLKKHNRYTYSPITERQDFTWPDGKRLAFYCALNVEHFSFGEGSAIRRRRPGLSPMFAITAGATTACVSASGASST